MTGDASYTLSVAAPAAGTYLLASDAAAFNSDVQFGETPGPEQGSLFD